MITQNFYFQTIIRILAVSLLGALAGWMISSGKPVELILLVILTDILFIFLLIHFLNTTNRRISYFLESVQNDDSTLTMPTNITDKSIHSIYQGLNKVNRQIQQLKIENRQREQYFQSIIEHLATGLITFNKKGFIIHTNSTAKTLLSLDILTHIQQLERIDLKLYQAIKTIAPSERRLVSISSERGEVQLALKASDFKMRDEELMIISIQDIRNELDEKELDSWIKLIRVLMHEIMNSLAPITSLSDSLARFFTSDGHPVSPDSITDMAISKTIQGLNVIQDQGKGLMSFVESYRQLTRIPQPDMKLFRVDDLMNRVSILYRSLAGSEDTDLFVSLKDPDFEIKADENLITQVLINLIKNALEANENNRSAKITITARTVSDKHTEICVADNGPGIPGNLIDEIFVPFYTTRRNGSGIGLSISKQIMRAHGGNLKVRSVAGKETVFCLSFQG